MKGSGEEQKAEYAVQEQPAEIYLPQSLQDRSSDARFRSPDRDQDEREEQGK